MTNQAHDDIKYTTHDYGPQQDFTATPSGNGFDVKGQCPACHGPTTTHHSLGSPQGYKYIWPWRRGTAPQPPLPTGDTTVICECGYPHAERPADSTETGCGAAWTVDLEWD